MNIAQKLRQMADSTGLDGFAEELRALAEEVEAAQPASAPAEPIKPFFASSIASRKWAELQEQGHRMQSLQFDGGPGGAGSIDPWGKVMWEAPAAEQGGAVGRIERKVYRHSPEHANYLRARFDLPRSISFEWDGHRWAYHHTSFDDAGEYDLLWRPTPANAQPAREPMTEADAKYLLNKSDLLDMFLHIGWYSAPRKNFDHNALLLLRAIEAHHGITAQAGEGK